jgi:hypothetical protein
MVGGFWTKLLKKKISFPINARRMNRACMISVDFDTLGARHDSKNQQGEPNAFVYEGVLFLLRAKSLSNQAAAAAPFEV